MDFTRIEQSEFQQIDYAVMGIVFEIHNEFGSMFDEKIYKRELALRLARHFQDIQAEVELPLRFRDFSKLYYCDLVIDRKVIYELKVVDLLSPEHERQLLQYLFLSNTKHGKLINFGSRKVESRFVSTNLSTEKRKQLQFDFGRFDNSNPGDEKFKDLILALLGDWGGFLSPSLYYEAVVHVLGGREAVIRPIEIRLFDDRTAPQKAHLLSDQTAFKITSLTKNIADYKAALARFLNRTKLAKIHWVNMNHHLVSFVTLNN